MHGARVVDEVQARPRTAREELTWQQIGLQTIAAATSQDEVARMVGATSGERQDVIQRGVLEIETRPAVHAAATTVTHGRALERTLLVGRMGLARTTWRARDAGESDVVIVPTAGHFTSRKKETPHDGTVVPSRGVRPAFGSRVRKTKHVRRLRGRIGQANRRCRMGVCIRLRLARDGRRARLAHKCEVVYDRARVFCADPPTRALTSWSPRFQLEGEHAAAFVELLHRYQASYCGEQLPV